MATLSTSFQNIARAVSAYSDQQYTDNVRIAGTSLIGLDSRISGGEEDFYGSIRFDDTLGALSYTGVAVPGATNINYGSETADEGLVTDMTTTVQQYIKTLRTVGANQYNTTSLITGRDGAIEKVARDFGRTRAQDADMAIVSVLKGVIKAEIAFATGGTIGKGQFQPDVTEDTSGFFYDTNRAINNSVAGANKLINTTMVGGSSAARLWEAAAAAYGDLEPEFFYLVVSPSVYQDIRSSNLLDEQDRISDGNIQVPSLLQGKFRLLVTQTDLGDYSDPDNTGAGKPTNDGSNKTSLLMLPGVLSMSDIAVPNPVAFDSDESVGRGTGRRESWYRWSNVYHPRGYSWTGGLTGFATNATYDAAASWTRVENVRNLGILPIFHS